MTALKSTARSLALFLAGSGATCALGWAYMLGYHQANQHSEPLIAQAEQPTHLQDWMEAVREADTDPLPPPMPIAGR